MDIFFERKSVRKYSAGDVSDADLKYILHAAMSAPTARNTRCYSFIVIKDKAMHKKIAGFNPASQMILEAPLAVLVVGDKNVVLGDYLPQDCAAATENMLLAATAKGYGCVWCGIYGNEDRMRDFSKAFNLPENIKPFSLVVMGKSADNSPAKNGWDESKIHNEKW